MNHMNILPIELHKRRITRLAPVLRQTREESIDVLVNRTLAHEDHVWAQSFQGLFDGAEVIFSCSLRSNQSMTQQTRFCVATYLLLSEYLSLNDALGMSARQLMIAVLCSSKTPLDANRRKEPM